MAYAFGGSDSSIWDGYLSSNPDVAAESARTGASTFGSPQAYAQWHYTTYGQNEGRQLPSANTGVSSQTPASNSSPDAISNWNLHSQNLLGSLKEHQGIVSNWKLGDDPNVLKASQTHLSNLFPEYQAHQQRASGLDPGALDWSTFYSGQNLFGGVNSTITGGLTSDQNERTRVDNFFNGYINNYNTADRAILGAPLNIDWNAQLEMLGLDLDELNSFETPLGSYAQTAREKALKEYDQLRDIITGRQGQAQTATNQVMEFERAILGQIDGLRGTLQGMSIRDLTDPNIYRNQINGLQRQLAGFKSPVGYDLSDEASELGSVQALLNELISKRSAEEQRIRGLQSAYGQQANSLSTAARGANLYDGIGLNSLEDQINGLIAQMTGETSELDLDFATPRSTLDTTLAGLGELRTKRAEALAKEMADVTGYRDQIPGLALHDEAGLNMLRQRLFNEQSDLSRFTGADDNMAALEAAMDQLDDRLFELQGKRTGIEGDLLAKLNAAKRPDQFYKLSDIDAFEDTLDPLMSDMNLYRATQAQDEWDALSQLLNNQRSRLTSENDALVAREKAEADRIRAQMDGTGNVRFGGVDPDTIMTEAQLAAQLRRRQDPAASYNSVFTSGLGL